MHLLAQIGGIVALVLGVLFLVCVALVNRVPVSKAPCDCPACNLGSNEAPAFLAPKPIKRARAARTPDRVIRGIHEQDQAGRAV